MIVPKTGGTFVGSLFDDIKKEQSKKGNRSRIAEILDTLPDDEKKDLLKALNDHAIPASNISKALAKRGHKLAINVISRYRRGELITEIK
jgi:threonine synthase